jgi:hypothetical protein
MCNERENEKMSCHPNPRFQGIDTAGRQWVYEKGEWKQKVEIPEVEQQPQEKVRCPNCEEAAKIIKELLERLNAIRDQYEEQIEANSKDAYAVITDLQRINQDLREHLRRQS